MSESAEVKKAVALGLLLESVEVIEMMRLSLVAAAKLLQDCKCQEARRAESLAAVKMGDAAIERMYRLNHAIVTLLPESAGSVQ